VFVANKNDSVDIGDTLDISKVRSGLMVSTFGIVYMSLLQVLLAGSRKATLLGHPNIAGATVRVQVEEKSKDKKVIIFKMRRRKNSKRLRGYRRQVTIFRVTDIILPDYANTIL
jgi:ribosomal protein L21